ncbi:hypothetical protein JB92DRAFT_3136826 [Gautieria morchelliformis]|nr:hypothetical protein JB92DRAFT_3136826 [Gautieria morchelliformis]
MANVTASLSVIVICRCHLALQERVAHPNGATHSAHHPVTSFRAAARQIHNSLMDEFGDPSIEDIGTSEAIEPHREDGLLSNAFVGIELEEIPRGRGPASAIDGDRHAGTAEGPLAGREGRSVVGKGLRAAGLARRGSEDVFAEGIPQRRTQLSGGLQSRLSLNGSRDGDLNELRRGMACVWSGLPDEEQDPRTPPSASGSVRTTSLSTYRSSYVLPERTMLRHTPQHERSRTSAYGRATQTPSSEHARVMLDSLTMFDVFDTQLARIPTSSSAPDLPRIAHSVVHANGLNTLLRTCARGADRG